MEQDFETVNTGEFFAEPMVADVTIKFGDEELPAHGAILYAKSTYFQKALERSDAKDGEKVVLELFDDHPVAVYDMLQYIYTGDYRVPIPWPQHLDDIKPAYAGRWGRHLELAIVAEKYGILDLKETALEYLETTNPLETNSDVGKFAARAQVMVSAQHRLNKVMLNACSLPWYEAEVSFDACFAQASFRRWLAKEDPALREDLFKKYLSELIVMQAFHDELMQDPAMAWTLLRHLALPQNTATLDYPTLYETLWTDDEVIEHLSDDSDDDLDEDYSSDANEDTEDEDGEDHYYEYEYEDGSSSDEDESEEDGESMDVD